jgi:hypothetical protein
MAASMNDEIAQRRASLRAEAQYKEQLAKDLRRVGAWQADLMREAAKRLHKEADELLE